MISREGDIEWIAFSERMREHPWSQRARRSELTPSGTPTSRLGDNGEQGSRETGESLLCEWFDGAPADLVVEEECVRLGSYGRVITMLSASHLPSIDEVEEDF